MSEEANKAAAEWEPMTQNHCPAHIRDLRNAFASGYDAAKSPWLDIALAPKDGTIILVAWWSIAHKKWFCESRAGNDIHPLAVYFQRISLPEPPKE